MMRTLAKVQDDKMWSRVGLTVVERGDGYVKVRARDGSWARIDQEGVRMWSPTRGGEAWVMKWRGSQQKVWFGKLLADLVWGVEEALVEMEGWAVVRGVVALALVLTEVA